MSLSLFRSTTRPNRQHLSRLSSSSSSSPPSPPPPPRRESTASSFLAQQALLEEEEIRNRNKKEPVLPELREPAWDGEETRERMLKRILDDQYKPLRVKGYQKPIPQPAPLPSQLFATPTRPPVTTPGSTPTSNESREPDAPKQPWEYKFKPPDHYQPALGYRPTTSLLVNPQTLGSRGESLSKGRGGGGAIKNKMVGGGGRAGAGGVAGKREQARKVRVFDAYEKTLDYRGGLHRTNSTNPVGTVEDAEGGSGTDGSKDVEGSYMAGQMRVYEGFIEEKIKKAREQGLFKNVKGRGKPLPRDEEEGNPFISRDDFLINRILKTQDAAPPWIELQKELEHSLSTFRSTLSSSWVRRAIRIRSSEGLTRAIVREVEQGWRDPEWEKKEEKYHEVAVRELNDLTRRFNIIAPYHVRRPLVTLEGELSRTISSSSGQIATELSRRLDRGLDTVPRPLAEEDVEEEDRGVRALTADEMGGEKRAVKESMWKAFRRVIVEVLGQPPDPIPLSRSAEHSKAR